MMDYFDDAYKIAHPRFLAAVYFALLAVIATISITSFLYLAGVEQVLPIFKSVLLSVFIAGLFGALFGKLIIHTDKPYRLKAFFSGFFLVVVALPFYDLILLLVLTYTSDIDFPWPTLKQFVEAYLFMFIQSFILFGFFLAILGGLAAMYLRGHLIYTMLHSDPHHREPFIDKKHFFKRRKERMKHISH